MIEAARSVNPEALDDPIMTDRLARAWTEIELARLLSLRALSRIIKGERPWPEVQFAKIEWAYLAQVAGRPGPRPAGPGRRPHQGRARHRRPGQVDPALLVPALQHHRRRLHRGAEEHHRRPGHQAPRPGPPLLSPGVPAGRDPRSPCLIGVGRRTWHPDDVGPEGAPEPLAMWEEVARLAAADAGAPGALAQLGDARHRLLPVLGVRRPDGPSGRAARRPPRGGPLLGHRRGGPPGAGHLGGDGDPGRPARPGPGGGGRGPGHQAPRQEGGQEARLVAPGRPSAAPSPSRRRSTRPRWPTTSSRPTSPSPPTTTPAGPTWAGPSTTTASGWGASWRR